MLQEHVTATCSGDKIVLSAHWGDMLQGSVAGNCRRDQIVQFAQLWKVSGTRFRDMLQRHILSCVLTLFHLCNIRICANFDARNTQEETDLRDFVQNSFFSPMRRGFNPWSNGLASSRKLKTCMVHLRLRLARPYEHLRWLAMTCDHFGRDQMQVFYRLATQRKSLRKFNLPLLATTCDYLRVRLTRALGMSGFHNVPVISTKRTRWHRD